MNKIKPILTSVVSGVLLVVSLLGQSVKNKRKK